MTEETPAFDPDDYGHLPERLVEVATQVHLGKRRSRTLRDVLGWFGQQRRGSLVNQRVTDALAELRLVTEPNFLTVGIDDRVGFVAAEEDAPPLEREVAPEVAELLDFGTDDLPIEGDDGSNAIGLGEDLSAGEPVGVNSGTPAEEESGAGGISEVGGDRTGAPVREQEGQPTVKSSDVGSAGGTPLEAEHREAERREAQRRADSETIANLQTEKYTVARYLDDDRVKHGLLSVKRQASVEEVLSLMRLHRYSQIPVTNRGDRELLGTVTWASLGRAIQINGGLPERLEDCWDTAQSIVKTSDSIVRLFRMVTQHGFALVRGRGEQFVTIFTATDLGLLYEEVSLNFVRLGEIEAHVRKLVRRVGLTPEQLRDYVHPEGKPPQRVEDLSFGAYKRILDQDSNFERTGIRLVSRKQFCERLGEVTELRNAVMHFDPDGLSSQQVRVLENFWRFLREVG